MPSKINRRSFLKFSLAGIFSAIMGKFTKSQAAAAGSDIYMPRQLITKDSSSSRTIMWQSRNPHASLRVQIRDAAGNVKNYMGSGGLFQDDGEAFYINRVLVNNLKPQSQYTYQIVQDGATTPWYPLSTSGSDTMEALIFPDSQCSDGYETWKKVASGAFNANPNINLFINMGDLVDNGEAAYQWRQWFNAIGAYMPSRIFVPLMGNHETYDLNWKCRVPHAFLNFFAVPDNNSNGFQRYYYSFDYGPVHFIVLNTQFEELDPIKPGMMEQQLQWLRQDVEATEKPWRVVLMHKDVINYDNLGSPEPLADIDEVGRRFMPYFDELGIHLVFTAHQHTYRRHNHIFNFEPSDHGPVYIDTGVAGNCRYGVPRTERFDKVMLPQPETDNYLTIRATSEDIIVQCYLPDGQVMDSFVLTNSKQV
ncbi:purple acid phosphatase [Anaerovibrio sp. JC8]|uniref:purple acid phosphatase family protein n=1 Tax=Anaerovibrio sp. JC8 TaxID=1240085 RepID=UPI000A0D594A|nr:metallophosphoesterase family protein [Anaerovibrio sp. JC8]ORU01076.1 purple acid phosphatase [Anaerovibrio sp. JC8]